MRAHLPIILSLSPTFDSTLQILFKECLIARLCKNSASIDKP